jgi:nucleoside-diphosphate-sugar epimerase
MRLLITGGERFIGLAIIRYIINDRKHTVVNLGNTKFLYKRIDEFDLSITLNDPMLGIDWPIGFFPSLSGKDINGKLLRRRSAFLEWLLYTLS